MSKQQVIETTIAEFIRAYNRGDIVKVLSYYGDDLIKIRQGALPETKAEIA